MLSPQAARFKSSSRFLISTQQFSRAPQRSHSGAWSLRKDNNWQIQRFTPSIRRPEGHLVSDLDHTSMCGAVINN